MFNTEILNVFRFYHDATYHNMTLESTQPIKEMRTRDTSWDVKAAGAWG